jgi:hypothetical protein
VDAIRRKVARDAIGDDLDSTAVACLEGGDLKDVDRKTCSGGGVGGSHDQALIMIRPV